MRAKWPFSLQTKHSASRKRQVLALCFPPLRWHFAPAVDEALFVSSWPGERSLVRACTVSLHAGDGDPSHFSPPTPRQVPELGLSQTLGSSPPTVGAVYWRLRCRRQYIIYDIVDLAACRPASLQTRSAASVSVTSPQTTLLFPPAASDW